MTDQETYAPHIDVLEPDDILIPEKGPESKQDRFEELAGLGTIHLSWTIRVIAATIGLSLLIVGSATLVTWAIFWLADLICMGKVMVFSFWSRWVWAFAKHTLGIGLGLTIASVNPPLGIGTTVLYFAYQEGQDLQKGKFFQMVRDYLRKFQAD